MPDVTSSRGRVAAPIDRNPDFGFARLLADGSMDASFGEGGVKRVPIDLIYPGYDVAYDMVEQADGKLVAVGMAETGEGQPHINKAVAVRVDEGGQLDPTFGAGGRAIYAFGPSPDSQTLFAATVSSGRVIAVGSVTNSEDNTTIDDVLVRLQNDRIFAGGFD
jgi:uncharacterized delta-60 repeat protein